MCYNEYIKRRKTRKKPERNYFMKITKKDALNLAIGALSAAETPDHDAIAVLQNMVDKLSVARKPASDEYRAKVSAERKEKAHAARVALMDAVLPVIRKTMTGAGALTAKEIFAIAQPELPADYTWQKVQAALLREMKPEVNVIEGTKKEPANKYELR